MSRVPASKKAISGIILGYFGSLRGHWGAHGCPKGIQGGSGVTLYRILNPSQSLIYGIRFGFKHHMMVQMANLRNVELSILILGFGALLGSPKMTLLEQIKPFWDSRNSQNLRSKGSNDLF